ncbi:MAG: hypothetical protein J7L61_02500 [Thermoplasmata archaeon]|nr:hypothetical protein [Thermoplasmata archaeon]
MPNIMIHLGVSAALGYTVLGESFRARWKMVACAAFAAALIDVDAFLSPNFRMFHNLFFTLQIPLLAFVATTAYVGLFPEGRAIREARKIGAFSLLVLPMAFGHLALDMWEGGTFYLLYPFSTEPLYIPGAVTMHRTGILSFTRAEYVLILWGLTVLFSRLEIPTMLGTGERRRESAGGETMPSQAATGITISPYRIYPSSSWAPWPTPRPISRGPV